MAAFEGAKKVGADIVCLQEPYVGGGVLAHPAYEIREQNAQSRSLPLRQQEHHT